MHQIRTKGDESFDDIYQVTKYIRSPKGRVEFDANEDQGWSPQIFKHHEGYGIIET